jgi:hypothetical protein
MTLLGVGYGAHKVLNEPLPDELSEFGPSQEVMAPNVVLDGTGSFASASGELNEQEIAPQPPAAPVSQTAGPGGQLFDRESAGWDGNSRSQSASLVHGYSDVHSSDHALTPESPAMTGTPNHIPLDGDATGADANGHYASSAPNGGHAQPLLADMSHTSGGPDPAIPDLMHATGDGEADSLVPHTQLEESRTDPARSSNPLTDVPASETNSAAEPLVDQGGVESDDVESHYAAAERGAEQTSESSMDAIRQHLDRNELSEALRVLSEWYLSVEDPLAMGPDRVRLMDQLAGTVVYSKEHMLERPHVVLEGETLDQVAARYSVPAMLIARINGLAESRKLSSGMELKILTGPFHGLASTSRRELTVFVGPYYAGRFPIRFGEDFATAAGVFEVVEKSTAQPYTDATKRTQIPAGDPMNPYGQFWIGLSASDGQQGERMAIHGVGEACRPDDNRGCIRLVPRDAEDLYAILSKGSTITFLR